MRCLREAIVAAIDGATDCRDRSLQPVAPTDRYDDGTV